MMLSQNRPFNSKKLLHKEPKPTTAAIASNRKASVGNQSPHLDELMRNLENNSISTSPRNKCDPYRKYQRALEMLNQSLSLE